MQEFVRFDLLIERMGFNLIHHRHNIMMNDYVHHTIRLEVAQPNWACSIFAVQRFPELSPTAHFTVSLIAFIVPA